VALTVGRGGGRQDGHFDEDVVGFRGYAHPFWLFV